MSNIRIEQSIMIMDVTISVFNIAPLREADKDAASYSINTAPVTSPDFVFIGAVAMITCFPFTSRIDFYAFTFVFPNVY